MAPTTDAAPSSAKLNPQSAGYTTAKLTWSAWPENETAYQWINEPPAGTARTNMIEQQHDAKIYDIRGQRQYTLDSHGFEALYDTPSPLSRADFDDEDKVKTAYYKHVEETLKRVTGGHRVFIFDHTIRRRPPPGVEVPDTPSSRQPVPRVHVDQTPKSGVARVRRHLGDEADELLKGKVQLINLWRSIGTEPVYDIPLAYASFDSLPIENLYPSDLIYSPEQIGETFAIKYSPDTRWHYLSQMRPDEAVLLKCFDSTSLATPEDQARKPGVAALTPHTAFVDDAYVGKDVPRRESIEVRALVFG